MNEETITETTNGINIEANQLSIDCITSNQNNFHLDSNGNLTVNSITTRQTSSDSIIDIVYPTGSIYMSVNDINPTTIFGGTWEAWGKGKVPVGVDASQTEFNTSEKTGGEKTHIITPDEMPHHDHVVNLAYSNGGSSAYYASVKAEWGFDGNSTYRFGYAQPTGNNFPHNNLQPYITCYMWKRVA